jgi:hypothetical protein
VLPLPKRQRFSKGYGFCGGAPAGETSGAGSRSNPHWWPDGQPQAILFPDRKDLSVRGARGDEIVGFWSAGGGNKSGAVLWRLGEGGELAGIDLHPASHARSYALGVGGGAQVGYGEAEAKKGQRVSVRALLWRGDGTVTELSGPDGSEALAYGTDGEFQVGRFGITGRHHGAIWRGETESAVDLSPLAEVYAVRDGEQAGGFAVKLKWHAGLWRGSAASLVDLTPKGFECAVARDCARGFQVGWVKKRDETPGGVASLETRAVMWNGSPKCFDLQSLLPAPWNASLAECIEFDGDRVRIIGEAVHAGTVGPGLESSPVKQAGAAVVWEGRLRS